LRLIQQFNGAKGMRRNKNDGSPESARSIFTEEEVGHLPYNGSVRPERGGNRTVTKDSIPWRCHATPLPEDALSQDDILKLASAHDVSEGDLRILSRKLSSVMRPKLALSQPELMPARRSAGTKNLKRLNDLLRMAQSKLDEASGIVTEMGFSSPFAHTGMPNPGVAIKQEFEDARATLDKCGQFFRTMETAGLGTFRGTPDKRKASDVRRTIVCTHIFNLWCDVGRKLSYSTDPVSGERTGPLIALVQDVVACLTDPRTRLSGETILNDLEAYHDPAR